MPPFSESPASRAPGTNNPPQQQKRTGSERMAETTRHDVLRNLFFDAGMRRCLQPPILRRQEAAGSPADMLEMPFLGTRRCRERQLCDVAAEAELLQLQAAVA